MRLPAILIATLALFSPALQSLEAGVDLSAGFSIGWPTGQINDYAFGAVGVGGTGRFGVDLGDNLALFGQFSYIDLGLEQGFIPRDITNSTLALDVATDFYFMHIGPGFTFKKKRGNLRPYLDLFGGVTVHSTLSRVSSRNIQPALVEYSKTEGTTWHAGLDIGLKMMIWTHLHPRGEQFIEDIFLDLRLGYLTGGNIEVLDWRQTRFFAGELHLKNLGSRTDMLLATIGISIAF
ncbi:MAG: hypothetical protein FVQ81_07095 [Candidatus Glassbacteria bacterium]|nr:hypothetical protein [Candidatus Glassbacteria bacterium]